MILDDQLDSFGRTAAQHFFERLTASWSIPHDLVLSRCIEQARILSVKLLGVDESIAPGVKLEFALNSSGVTDLRPHWHLPVLESTLVLCDLADGILNEEDWQSMPHRCARRGKRDYFASEPIRSTEDFLQHFRYDCVNRSPVAIVVPKHSERDNLNDILESMPDRMTGFVMEVCDGDAYLHLSCAPVKTLP